MFLANAADAAIDVKVEVTEKMGSETYLYLTTTGKEGNIIARVNPRTTSVAGAEIKVAFDVNHLHFFDKETARTILVSGADQDQSDEVIHFTQNFQEALSP